MTLTSGAAWVEEEPATPRPYVITSGRTVPGHELGLSAIIAVGRGASLANLDPEVAQIVALCGRRPTAVAEIAGTLRLALQVVRILLSDLIEAGIVAVLSEDPAKARAQDPVFLRSLLGALEKWGNDAA
ncbi:DUF742 domain-containing protein [Kitasatospora sp. NPDC094028]